MKSTISNKKYKKLKKAYKKLKRMEAQESVKGLKLYAPLHILEAMHREYSNYPLPDWMESRPTQPLQPTWPVRSGSSRSDEERG